MLFIPVPNVGEFKLNMTYFGQEVQNVFHVLDPAGWDISKFETMCNLFRDWWINELSELVSNSVTLRNIGYRDLTEASGLGGERANGLPSGGLEESPGMPGNVTLSVKWNTGHVGRSYRGRTYHIGLCESQCVGNTVSPTLLPLLQTAYANLITSVQGTFDEANLVVVSKFSGVDADGKPIPRTEGIATRIIDASINPDLDSQRRRLNGRGL